jgi:hypothetical protein
MEIVTFFPVAAASFHNGWKRVAGHFPAALLYHFSSAQWLSNSLEEHFQVAIRLKWGDFQPFSQKGHVSVNIYKRLKEHLKSLKTASGFSPRSDLSNNITFG